MEIISYVAYEEFKDRLNLADDIIAQLGYKDKYDSRLDSDILEINFKSITEKEEALLKKYNINYRKIGEDKIRILESRYSYYYVETDASNKGIYLEKTKQYYYIIETSYGIMEDNEDTINLIISKEGVRVEIIYEGMSRI